MDDWASRELETLRMFRNAAIAEMDRLAAEVASLRAAVERARDVCTEGSYNDASGDLIIRASDVLRALNGEA